MTYDVINGPSPRSAAPANRKTIAVLATAQFLVVLNGSVVNVALPEIGADLNLVGAGLNWVVTTYVLALGGLLLLGGRVADVVGARKLMTAAAGAFSLASLAAALAPTGTVLLIARTLQGAAAAMLAPAALSLVHQNYRPGPERRRALSVWGAVGSAGGAIGALGGGIVTDQLGWRAVLLTNIPIGVALMRALPRMIPAKPAPPSRRKIGFAASATASAGIAAFLIALTTGRDNGWTSPTTLTLVAVSLALAAWFLATQRHASDPLVPLEVLRRRSLLTGNAAVLLGGAALFPTMLLLSLYMQRVLGYSALRTGFAMMPLSGATVVAAALAPRLLGAAGARKPIGVGLSLLGAGTAWLATTPTDAGYFANLVPPMVLFGTGLGLTFVPATYLAVNGLEPHRSGLGSALLNTSQQLGGAVGLAVFVTLAEAHARGSSTTGGEVADVLAAGYRIGFGGTAACVGVALVVTLALTRRTADAPQADRNAAAAADKGR